MANEMMKRGGSAVAAKQAGAGVKHAKKAAKKAAKKTAKKAAKKGAKEAGGGKAGAAQAHGGVRTAFHHMQRASVVISLMEKGSGEDLRALLARGVALYAEAFAEARSGAAVLKAIGVLRAAEHLALAGLYAARQKHQQKAGAPASEWLEEFLETTEARLRRIEDGERGAGTDLHPVAEELVRQAEEAGDDAHLAYELAMAADALCFALENGL